MTGWVRIEMFTLAPLMIEKVGIIVIVAFLLSRMKSFRQMVQKEHTNHEKVMLILLFGAFGLISNYTAVEIHPDAFYQTGWITEVDHESALANTRVMGVVIGALLGGPMVGLGAGLISGIHRYTLGGFTAFACSVSTIFAGLAAGYISKKRKQKGKKITAMLAVGMGMTFEAIQMLMILVTAKPFLDALSLVEIIALPMIFINGFGTLLFMFIIDAIKREEESVRANQTNLAFRIADRTLPYFRQGLNAHSCKKISEIIWRFTAADAVAITNNEKVLSHVGAASDHHVPMTDLITGLTKKAIEREKISVATSKEEIFCSHESCPLEAAIVIPLKIKNRTAGTLKMYFTDPDQLDNVQKQLAEGLANLFSTQLELAEAERQAKLLKDAEIKALQAQIHPHFLFNSMNTISALCRTDAKKARKLLLEFSSFIRGNLQGAKQTLIPLEKELKNVRAYIFLEQARFPDKYHIEYDIEPNLEKEYIPPFTLQPLVENAIHYGISGRKSKGNIIIKVYSEKDRMQIVVADNGKGIAEEKLKQLGKEIVDSKKGNGSAIYNINERLKGIYSGQASLTIESKENDGTTVKISIPLDDKGGLRQVV